MIKIAILEDDQKQAECLTNMLKKYRDEHEEFAYTVNHYDKSMLLLVDYHCDVDLLLLDIQMPDMSGMDVAKRIRAIDDHVMIVFITTVTQYAIEGYLVKAFDYVVKPLLYDTFKVKMDRIRKALVHQKSSISVEVRNKEEIRLISADDIIYIEVSNHDVLIHTFAEVYRQWGSLKQYEALLRNAHFARCNACYLVNLKHIQRINGDSVRVHQDDLAISKSRRKDFLAAIAQYKGGSR